MSRASSLCSGHSSTHSLEQAGREHDVRAGLLEQVEELALLGSEQPGELDHGARV
jgi:hypothetical protein